jgi:hypothetical protein
MFLPEAGIPTTIKIFMPFILNLILKLVFYYQGETLQEKRLGTAHEHICHITEQEV